MLQDLIKEEIKAIDGQILAHVSNIKAQLKMIAEVSKEKVVKFQALEELEKPSVYTQIRTTAQVLIFEEVIDALNNYEASVEDIDEHMSEEMKKEGLDPNDVLKKMRVQLKMKTLENLLGSAQMIKVPDEIAEKLSELLMPNRSR